MNYEGNEEYFEKEIIKTTKLVDLVLEEHELKEDYLNRYISEAMKKKKKWKKEKKYILVIL